MKHLILFAGMAFSVQFLAGADSPVTPPSSSSALPVAVARNADVEKLIDELVNVSTVTVGTGTNYGGMSRFIVNDRPAVISGGVAVATLPPPPAMRQLVQMGVAAVPALLDHLTDARETKLVIKNPGMPRPGPDGVDPGFRMGFIEYNNEYDPRYRDDPARMPANVETLSPLPPIFSEEGANLGSPGDYYTVPVGDLCYVLLGQIVDRNLTAARYQGTGFEVINSPVHAPALALAARQDWAGLTIDQHQASLMQDATSDAHYRLQNVYYPDQHADAFERLSYYYPETAKTLALKALSLPLQDWHNLPPLNPAAFPPELLNAPDAAAQTAWLTDKQKQWGNGYIFRVQEILQAATIEPSPILGPDGQPPAGWGMAPGQKIPFYSHREGPYGDNGPDHEILGQPHWDRARAALKIIETQGWVATFDKHSVADIGDLTSIIGALGALPDPAIDVAVHDLFHRAQAIPGEDATPYIHPLDQLAQVCFERLAGKRHDDEYQAYFEQRIAQFSKILSSNKKYATESIASMNAILAKLGPAANAPAVKP